MKDAKKKILKAFENKTDEEINAEFSDLIRETLTDKQFWKYVSAWKDGGDVADEMEDWDIETKREAIEEIREMFKIKCQ